MKHLFEDWDHIQARIRQAKNLFFFLDYDGTLAPIASRPELAFCPPEIKGHLERLRDRAGVHLAIVSGRALEDLREKVGVPGIIYVGNHGLEIKNLAGLPCTRTVQGRHKKILSSLWTKELKKITRNLQHSLKEIPGILFEEKGLTLSVHYRNVDPRFFNRIPKALEEELRHWEGRWRMTSGKMVLDIRPNVDFHKGDAAREILKTVPSSGLLPIYLGDDQTDEDAFRVLKGQGISVFIGPAGHPSEADFFLRNPDEVQEFLSRCEELRKISIEHGA
jgi:trehalose-phosphatase